MIVHHFSVIIQFTLGLLLLFRRATLLSVTKKHCVTQRFLNHFSHYTYQLIDNCMFHTEQYRDKMIQWGTPCGTCGCGTSHHSPQVGQARACTRKQTIQPSHPSPYSSHLIQDEPSALLSWRLLLPKCFLHSRCVCISNFFYHFLASYPAWQPVPGSLGQWALFSYSLPDPALRQPAFLIAPLTEPATS